MKPRSQHLRERPILQGALMILLVVLAYLPALRGQFLWDDDDNVINNRTLRSLDGLRRIWFEPGATQQYYPLTHTSFWLDYHMWGLNPLGYHAGNILLHAISALLIWRILQRLGVKAAWFGAALFALHPTCVESVAWITERKNTLSGVFFLSSILACLRFWLPGRTLSQLGSKSRSQPDPIPCFGSWKFYWLALGLYVCALWAKTAAVGLPVVIVFLLWWKRGKLGWRNVFLMFPFLTAGVAMGLITMWVEKRYVGAVGMDWQFSWVERCLIAGRALWFYVGKLLFPHPLEFMYPRWLVQPAQPLAYLPVVTAVAGILILWRIRNAWARPILFTSGYFIAMLLPVLGFFNVFFFRYSFVCDHFQYLACIAPLALAASGISFAVATLKKGNHLLEPLVCGMVLLALGTLTWRQTGDYRDNDTLWRNTLARNPGAWMAENNLGLDLVLKGRFDEGIEHYVKALESKPNYAPIYDNWGNALAAKRDFDAAIQQYDRALQLDPDSASTHNNIGNALAGRGDLDAATQHYLKALEIAPLYATAHNDLGSALARQGKLDEAIQHFSKAIQLAPEYAEAHGNLAKALGFKGDLDGSVDQHIQVLRIHPDDAQAHYNLGMILVRQNKPAQAQDQFVEAVRLKPRYEEAEQQLRAISSSGPKIRPIK